MKPSGFAGAFACGWDEPRPNHAAFLLGGRFVGFRGLVLQLYFRGRVGVGQDGAIQELVSPFQTLSKCDHKGVLYSTAKSTVRQTRQEQGKGTSRPGVLCPLLLPCSAHQPPGAVSEADSQNPKYV